jgi:hypothetical protein
VFESGLVNSGTKIASRSENGRAVPSCSGLGKQCREVPVLLKIGSLEEGPDSLDHESTWLLGHTAQVTFGELSR